MKKIIAILLMLCLAVSLCACGGSNNTVETTTEPAVEETTTEPETTEPETTEPAATGTTYTVKVVDEGGNPIASAAVQLCKESCLPGMTNAEGVAAFRTVEDDYKVSFMTMPAGYEADAEEFYFESGSYEMTITLKAVA